MGASIVGESSKGGMSSHITGLLVSKRYRLVVLPFFSNIALQELRDKLQRREASDCMEKEEVNKKVHYHLL